MAKKILFTIISLLMLSVTIYAVEGDLFSVDGNLDGTDECAFTSNGKLICNDVEISSGVSIYRQAWANMLTANTSGHLHLTAGTTTLLVNVSSSIYAGTTGNGFTNEIKSTQYARDLAFKYEFPYYGSLSTITAYGNAWIYGVTSTGKRMSEYMTVSSTYVAKSNYAWMRISTITYTMTYCVAVDSSVQTTVEVNIGFGTKVGLDNNINYKTDILGVDEAATDTTESTWSVNTFYDTITFVTAPNGSNEQDVWYRIKAR